MRYVGIRHRVKRTAEGEASPTQVCVIEGDQIHTYDLATETDELDWILNQFSTSWRLAERVRDGALVEEFRSGLRQRNLRWRKLHKGEDAAALSEMHFLEEKQGRSYILEIFASFDGLRKNDIVGTTLGGSGDRLAFALSRQAEELGGETRVMRIRPAKLQEWRESYFRRDKNDDAKTLAELVRDNKSDFYPTTRRDRDLIRLTEVWRDRVDAMTARIGAEQRLRSHFIGQVFCSEEGKYPEGEIELLYEEQRASDRIIQALLEEERVRSRAIEGILRELPVYDRLFVPIKGIGPMIAARLIVAIGDPRRFDTDAKLKAFVGVHVMQGGRFGERGVERQFVRRRHGEVANWHPEGRQALYLLTDQFNRHPESFWGQKLRDYKVKLSEKHGTKNPIRILSGLAPAFRTAEQWFLEAGHPNPMPDGSQIQNLAEFTAWVTQCLRRISDEHRGIGLPEIDLTKLNRKLADLSVRNEGSMITVYSKSHIHRMASWRTATKFVEWLWREWTRLEQQVVAEEKTTIVP